MQKDCIFCKIIAGEIPSSTIYEDDDFKVIMDIFPASKGHAVLVPKNHYANLYELEDSIAAKALLVARNVGEAMKEELGFDGLNILQNNGEAAGQTIFHFHIHLIPRYLKDEVNITWTHGNYKEGEAAAIAKAISNRMDQQRTITEM